MQEWFENINTYVVMGASLVTSFIAYQWVIPYIQNIYKTYKDQKQEEQKHQLNIGKEIYETKQEANKTYQDQLDFQLDYIGKLQTTINGLSEELDKLRDICTNLKNQVMENKGTISSLKNSCCNKLDCKDRIRCNID